MKLTRTIPFSMATPNTVMNPIADGTDTYCPLMKSAIKPANCGKRHVRDDQCGIFYRIERGIQQTRK